MLLYVTNSASGHPQHLVGDSFDCCTERYELVVYCLANFPSLPVRSGFDVLFPVTTFLTVSQLHDTLISMFLYIT